MSATFGDVVQTEQTKLLRRPMTWILGVIFIGLLGLIYFSLTIAVMSPEFQGEESSGMDEASIEELKQDLVMPDGFSFALAMTSSFASLLLIILAAGSYGSEFSWGTVRTNLIAGADRVRCAIGKFVALLVFALLATLLGAVVGFIAPVAIRLLTGDGPPTNEWLNAGFFLGALWMSGIIFLALAMWVLIASTITLMTRSLAAGAGITLGLNLGGGIFLSLISEVGTVGRWFSRLFPNQAIGAMQQLVAANPPGYGWTDFAWITANLLIYAVGLTTLALIRFPQNERTGGFEVIHIWQRPLVSCAARTRLR